jgi:hypothetical protein
MTLQDQFGMLKQIGYLPESVHAARSPGRLILPRKGTSWTCT